MLIQLLAVPVLIACNAFFVAAEYAVVAVRDTQLEAMRRAGRRRAASAMAKLKADQSSAIGAIQVCITMTNLMLGWIGEPAMAAILTLPLRGLAESYPRTFGTISLALSFLVVTFFTVVFSELLPKALTLRYVQNVATVTARPILLIRTFVTPLVWLMNAAANLVTRPLGLGRVDAEIAEEIATVDEIRFIASKSAKAGVLSHRERSLILNSLSFGRRQAKQIMVPRVKVQHLDLQWSIAKNREMVNQHLHNRLPLCNGGMDHVIGIVAAREFLTAMEEDADVTVLQLLARPAVFAPDNIRLDELLLMFDDKRTQMVLLVDEHGGVEGLATLRDVVDELVGEPMKRVTPADEELAARSDPDALELDAGTPIVDVARLLNREGWASDEDVVTVGGLLVVHFKRIPHAGESVEIEHVQLEVLESDNRAVRKVRVMAKPLPPADPEDDEAALDTDAADARSA